MADAWGLANRTRFMLRKRRRDLADHFSIIPVELTTQIISEELNGIYELIAARGGYLPVVLHHGHRSP